MMDWAALAIGVALGVSLLTLGFRVATGMAESADGVPLGMYFFMGSIPLLAAAGDIRMLAVGGLAGRQRLVRHLWRMCFGWFIATGSFFLGQQQVFPVVLRKNYLLFPLALCPFALLIYWLIRFSFFKRTAVTYLSPGVEGAKA